jgi:ribose/xylose/arabinose/galactoside ABC-type transport system permease subunit
MKPFLEAAGGFFRRFAPQLITLAVVLTLNTLLFPGFLDIGIANGRLYGSLIDILNRGAPVALLAIGMTLVIATRGIDLSVGAVMAICGAAAPAAAAPWRPSPLPLGLVWPAGCGTAFSLHC